MRRSILLRYFGRFHLLISVIFLVPMLVGFAYQKANQDILVWSYVGPSLLLVGIGLPLSLASRGRPTSSSDGLRRREGFVLVSVSWILMILYGALPYLFSGATDEISAAIFESASGFTTTGATIFRDIEALDNSLLFWRSFSQWLGGMGIIVLSVAILPELAVGGMQLFTAESSGIGVSKLAPRITATAKRLWVLYAALTAAEIVALWLGGMSFFDAVTHSFATTATGGFSPNNESVGHYRNLYFELVMIVFMLLAGTNFTVQYRVFQKREFLKFFTHSEVRLYTGIALGATLLIALDLFVSSGQADLAKYSDVGTSLRDSSFQVVSTLTTTGFGTADFDLWPTFSKCIIVILMAVGGCAGSTAGGLKIIRLVVVLKHAGREFQRLIHPRVVKPITVDGKAIDDETLWSILGFFFLYVLAFLGTLLILSVLPHGPDGTSMDLVTSSTASLSALNSIGPGLGQVGPVENFADIHWFGKLTLSFCMVLGRLEIYTLLILFMPRFWNGR